MNLVKKLYQLSFYLVTIIVFVLGGTIQFLFGASNTIITFFITCFLFCIYLIYTISKNRIVFNKVVFIALAYTLLIIGTAIIRESSIVATIAYLIFPILPLAVYLFSFINYREGYVPFEKAFQLFFYIGLLQLPVLLIQKNFYGTLIGLNNSGQQIESFDFMFGTFFIKSDHSLGIFLLVLIAIILFKRSQVITIVRLPKLTILYLSATLFLTESNISKLFLVILISTFIIIPVYKKYGRTPIFKITAVALFVIILFGGYSLKDQQFIQNKLGGTLEKQFSIESAEKYYELGTAKRFQIILVASKKIETKWIGDGPYSYFDILTGKFKQTRHFTQLIWTYYDLGLLGLLVVLGYIISLMSYLDIEKGIPFMFALGIFLVYSLYTTILSDIAIIFGIMSIFNRKNKDLQ